MEVKPIKKFSKTLRVASDKSITHRAIMFNAIASGSATITHALLGDDCVSTIDCMRRLGAHIETSGDTVTVEGCPALKSAHLNAGNSGTTFRLLCGLLSGIKGEFTIDGDESLRRRPMRRVIEPLSAMGATISSENLRAPVKIIGRNLVGISYKMPVASAQVKSAILLAGIGADGITGVHEKIRSRNHTELMLKAMGAKIWMENNSASVMRSRLNCVDIDVPADISSAAFPMVLACCHGGGEVRLERVGVNPTRTGILTALGACGASVTLSDERRGAEKSATITVRYTENLRPFTIGRELVPYLVDEIPVLAVLACFINGESVISGAEELKVKETNRIDATVEMLRAFGADIEATDDGMIVRGGCGLVGGCRIDPRGDHRIAMAAAVAAALSRDGAEILDPDCVAISYPDFYKIFEDCQ